MERGSNFVRLDEIFEDLGDQYRSRVRIVHHDLSQAFSAELIAEIGDVDYILHVAANCQVSRSINTPLSVITDNVIGTANLLEYARYHTPNLQKFINFSSAEMFGIAPLGIDFSEYNRYNSRNPYAASKAAAEELCVAYANSFNLPMYCVHTMNVFGERQRIDKFTTIIMRKIIAGETVSIHGDVQSKSGGIRRWIHGADVAAATEFIMNLVPGEFELATDAGICTCPKFNIVGPEDLSNLDIAQKVAKVLNLPLNYELLGGDSVRPGHDFRYSMSNKYLTSLGWAPEKDFDTRLEEAVNWTLNHTGWLYEHN
jgi:dTDP-glucose 4,6-dehydratase